MNRLSLLALLGLSVISGCSAFGPNADDVLFETTANAYSPGDAVTARLVNSTSDGIGYNLCHTTIEAKRGTWEPVAAANGGLYCQAILLGLEAGDEAEHVIPMPDDLASGQYRLVTNVEFDYRDRVTVTAPFEVW